MNVGVYELNGRGTGAPFYIEIPDELLPPGGVREIEEEEPGYFHEYPRWIHLQTGKRAKDGRLPIFLYKDQMRRLNIDLNRMPSIKIQGLPYIWFDAHLIYRWENLPFYGRVWLSRRVVDALKIKPESTILAKVRGTSYPKKKRVTVIERYVEVTHMEKTYPAEIRNNKWIWTIPETIQGYEILVAALQKNYIPIAECNLVYGRINVDFSIRKILAKRFSEGIGYSWLNITVRNYAASVTIDYPFYADFRAEYVTSLPLEYYHGEDHVEHFMKLMNALQITVQNMVSFFLYSVASAENKNTVDYEVEGELKNEKVHVETGLINGETRDAPFYHVIKQVTLMNEYLSKSSEKIYTNEEIEDKLEYHDYCYVDKNGFIWIKPDAPRRKR